MNKNKTKKYYADEIRKFGYKVPWRMMRSDWWYGPPRLLDLMLLHEAAWHASLLWNGVLVFYLSAGLGNKYRPWLTVSFEEHLSKSQNVNMEKVSRWCRDCDPKDKGKSNRLTLKSGDTIWCSIFDSSNDRLNRRDYR